MYVSTPPPSPSPFPFPSLWYSHIFMIQTQNKPFPYMLSQDADLNLVRKTIDMSIDSCKSYKVIGILICPPHLD